MTRKQTPKLTEGELRIMEEVWALGEASVKAVADRLADRDKPGGGAAYTTVQTMMGILEDKGFLNHHKQGRAFVYKPLVEREQARARALRQILGSFFGGDASALIQNLIKDEAIDLIEFERLREQVMMLDSRSEGED